MFKKIEKFNQNIIKEYGKNIKAIFIKYDDCKMQYYIVIDNLVAFLNEKKFDFDLHKWKEKIGIDIKHYKIPLTQVFEKVSFNDLEMLSLIKEANIVYDPSYFLTPMKNLLNNGLVLGTQESVTKVFEKAKERFKKVELYKKDILYNTYRAILDAAAAAFIARNYSVPVPQDVPKMLKKYFVKKNILEKVYVSICEDVIKKYNNYERGVITHISGKELNELHNAAFAFVERMKTLVGLGHSGSDAQV